jgi:hypothetical protein
VCDYDRSHLLIYAELIDADDAGTDWADGAISILGIDPGVDWAAARICWDTHLARARWIIGAGLPAAIEAFGRSDLPSS